MGSYTMSVPILKNTNVVYLNLEKIGTGVAQEFCEVSQRFNTPIVDKASEYLLAIERFSLPIQSIPVQPEILNAFVLVPRNPAGGLPQYNLTVKSCYSLQQFLVELNRAVDQNGNTIANLSFRIDSDFRISVRWDQWGSYDIAMSERIRQILDFGSITLTRDDIANGANIADGQYVSFRGATSIADRFDQLIEIRLETEGVPTVSELLSGDRRGFIITDLLNPTNYGYGFNVSNVGETDAACSINDNPRQNIIFNADSRRYIQMSGAIPIRSIKVIASAIVKQYDAEGSTERQRIRLPAAAVMNIKFSFTSKSN